MSLRQSVRRFEVDLFTECDGLDVSSFLRLHLSEQLTVLKPVAIIFDWTSKWTECPQTQIY